MIVLVWGKTISSTAPASFYFFMRPTPSCPAHPPCSSLDVYMLEIFILSATSLVIVKLVKLKLIDLRSLPCSKHSDGCSVFLTNLSRTSFIKCFRGYDASCGRTTVSKKNISKFLSHLINLLNNKNFFKPKEKREAMLLNINNLFYRCELSNKELRILASIVSNLSKKNFKA